MTVLDVVKKTAEFFSAKGIESPRLNAELLVGHALRLPRMQLYLQFERILGEPELEAVRGMARRRGQREPLQYVIGETEFHGLKLKVDRRALIPRPETERLVELLIERADAAPPARVLDLGTGTGALALALARAWPAAEVWAADSSPEALALAAENAAAAALGDRLKLLPSDWLVAVPPGERFDLIVSNPPYLTPEELAAAAPEVRGYEPAMALVSGRDGMDATRTLLQGSRAFLAAGGMLALETGTGQHAALRNVAETSGWSRTESVPDLTGRERYLLAW